MRDRGAHAGTPLWLDGDMLLRVRGLAHDADQIVKIRRPYALIGRSTSADIWIDDAAVSMQHVYLHLDPRGLFAVDLMTRTGSRIGGSGRMAGWMRPGDELEVAGRRIELLRLRIAGAIHEPGPCEDSPLAPSEQAPLVHVRLEKRKGTGPHWLIGSELAFLGRSPACAIQVNDVSAGRIHCALWRTAAAAYLVNLTDHQTWIEDRPVRGAAVVADGELLMIGSSQFTVRLEPVSSSSPQPGRSAATELVPFAAAGRGLDLARREPPNVLDLIPTDSQASLLAWMMGAIQSGQGEILRQQGEFQFAVTEVLRQIQQDSATLLTAHLERIEMIDRELATLRAEIALRERAPATGPRPAGPPAPPVAPLRIARPAESQSTSSKTTAWLLERVNDLEKENRSAWKDLLGRLSATSKRPS